MKFLFDSNAVISLLKGSAIFLDRLRQYSPNDFGLSAVVMHELYYGACKSKRRDENISRVEGLQFEVLDFDREDAQTAGEIRATLASSGLSIGPYDVLIAGQALARGLVLITHNTREFARVPRLLLEDWELPLEGST